jgi:hypothetical protein
VGSSDQLRRKAPGKKPGPKLLESVLNAEAEAEGGQALSYAKEHISLLYYERHGCMSCHTKNGPHHACGMCCLCYHMVRERRKSIIEGKKIHILKLPARFGVPSLLGRGAKG